MIVSFNCKLLDSIELEAMFFQRAINYGDGLFETIILKNNEIRSLSDHLKRLKMGMKALGFEGVNGIRKELIEHQLWELIQKNKIQATARIKIQVWRKNGGLFTPENRHFNMLITAVNPENPVGIIKETGIKVDFSETVKLSHSVFSRYKTLNALPYVLAGIEKYKRGLDEIILLDREDNIAEASSSNIFWVKNGIVYTPKLSTGCIAGVTRKNIIRTLIKNGIEVRKVKSQAKKILKSDHVFTSNTTTINHISSIKDVNYTHWNLVDEFFG